jgi:hypothetical protein
LSSVPLTQAVTSGDAGAVSAVLANGADVNERTGGGQTPIILATIFGHTHLIPLLLEAGADPQLRDNLGLNAIDWAQRRGATEAIDVLKNKTTATPATRPASQPQTPHARHAESVEREVDKPKFVSPDEKSQRWLAGLKQRIAEQSQRIAEHSQREIPEGPNIFRVQSEPRFEIREPQPEIPAPSEPAPELPVPPPELPEQPPELPEQPPELPEQPPPPPLPEPKPEIPSEPLPPEPQVAQTVPAVEEKVPARSSGRKRCPKCNAIYNSDLVAYCAHHFVPLVDADAPPIISEPLKPSPVMFWMIIVITLTGSVVLGSLITAYFYNSSKAVQPVAGSPAAAVAVQKGMPVVDEELEGKVLSLPVAECPLNGQEAIPGTVVVRIVVDKSGQVTEARASGGDWLLRGAATEAAMKSTFSPAKLRSRETEGTITYTFEP